MKLIEQLAEAVRAAATYNPDVQAAPHCILWPDAERQWLPVLPRLQRALPELLTLGEYAPQVRRGPAIWLRCAIAGALSDLTMPLGMLPILYLPGVSRQDLRAVDTCPDALKPLAELQYRGAIWSQLNAKDWTVLAFLKSNQGGLGLDVAQDGASTTAMHLALAHLLDEEVDTLKGKHLNDEVFYKFVVPDSVRDMLRWLDEPEAFKSGTDAGGWQAFVALSKSKFGFDPEAQGALSGAARLAEHKGAWSAVWARFCEAPAHYPNIPKRMRQATMPTADLYASAASHGSWPQWNDAQEQLLCDELAALTQQPPHEARSHIAELDAQHGARRALVWAELGQAPFALLLEHLTALAAATAKPIPAGSAQEMAAAYRTAGWLTDDAMMRTLACSVPAAHQAEVLKLARQLYEGWANEAARHLQETVRSKGYPGGTIDNAPEIKSPAGQAVLFVDGLRFDLAQRLAETMRTRGLTVTAQTYWAALPSVTATAKPAVSPVRKQIRGEATNVEFEPDVADTGKALTSAALKGLLKDAGWQVSADSLFAQATNGWFEMGDVDTTGHHTGWKLAQQVEEKLVDVADHVMQLLDAGWTSVRVVTDHGWVLLPGGLPKTSLHATLTENRWGRAAAVKPGALTDVPLFPWYWNPAQSFALADGISCFIAGTEYAHGGLSLQECVLDSLLVERASLVGGIAIASISWKGLICRVTVTGETEGLEVDLRTHPGNGKTTVATAPKPFKQGGTASLVVENEDLTGESVTVVVVGAQGQLLAQKSTTVGGE